MSAQLGTTVVAPRGQASFLHGGITIRYLPSADVTPFVTQRSTPARMSDTLAVDCSINPHIPACAPYSSDCSAARCPPDPTGPFCPTREFVC
jgi:hypothetical protein